ncbi:hypothetical protein [Halomarina oriensis]|uniref:Uncharacterized protein n=1 Tax=Halomarina oriensis TaxID=671145 RepID=A0A6B0GVN9_9EURY|nr:hypothetical protein [Halomarina oriensis]MWG36205.1 hypothetical protein [Halomarina oriensis]
MASDHREAYSALGGFNPMNVCRECSQPDVQCICEAMRLCPVCSGRGFSCFDDLCHAQGTCSHSGTCSRCDATGGVRPERVLVVPDRDAAGIREYLRDHPELRKGEYDHGEDVDPLTGLCYPAAEAYYHLNDCDLDVYCLSWSDVDESYQGTHWYLREPGDGRFIDLGLPLMPPVELPPFEQGRRRGFITGDEPSKRTQQVLDAVRDGRGENGE